MENLEEISILGTMIAAGVWYLKHKVVTSSKIQLEMLKEFERNKNQELLESFKSDLAIKSEIFKTKHLSIYERKLHALLDSFACVSDCESPMGKISEDWSTNNGAQFPKLSKSRKRPRRLDPLVIPYKPHFLIRKITTHYFALNFAW